MSWRWRPWLLEASLREAVTLVCDFFALARWLLVFVCTLRRCAFFTGPLRRRGTRLLRLCFFNVGSQRTDLILLRASWQHDAGSSWVSPATFI